ncbi:MAG: GNAT family N-acetyltransferase [Lachnospiraceae bacterium]|nr:GNAT family N-acetyltransferase [Lachnospiraceae bacterium]
MAVKINSLSEEDIRAIGDAFADFEYDENEWGMSYFCKDKQAVSDYICAYVDMAIKEHVLYSTSEAHEAFIVFKRSGMNMSLTSASGLIGTIPGKLNMDHTIEVVKGIRHAGKSYGQILAKLKIPHIYVGMVAVTEKYQGQGFMRKLLEIAYEEGRKDGLPVVLDTDAELKKAKYEHVGMKCVITQHLANGVELYGMVYEPDNVPKEWKSERVLEDMRILSADNKNVWDRFANVYTGFVTGTPGNKRSYEAMYKRIRKVVKDKEVLEIATGPGIIAKEVAPEAKKMTATDYSEKMLAVARRGVVPDNLEFEYADAHELKYADNSFDVVIISNALHIVPNPEIVLSEIRRVLRPDGILVAPNFVHDGGNRISNVFSKALSVAGVVFEAKWDMNGYLAFLEDNGFCVKRSKQLPSSIPLVYTECVPKENLEILINA